MGITFIIAAIAVVIWALSLIVRRKNHKTGIILSYVALLLIVIACILHFVL
ncbi:MAG: hypothetical protein IKR94_06060 [Bacteroidales bacterium]|nr:hypothetical protein [Bacteroidales bacterium]MBR4214864.1 hypothetical protein [Bacteroidales bacterium]